MDEYTQPPKNIQTLTQAMDQAIKNTSTGKREHRQAEILRIARERTNYLYHQYVSGLLTDKELGGCIRRGEADLGLVRARKEGDTLCCLLCVRHGKRCICRKVTTAQCTNCGCLGCGPIQPHPEKPDTRKT
ncbi:bud site selection protein 31 [Nematocida displodere]|uniref:Bud site selection protein 31 n=1 Tax=Nematocida displodere TaxID=1805483 RepID=A0A177EJU5_9MICR|nr:bud site selection protein 31 [Nematocida displodere]